MTEFRIGEGRITVCAKCSKPTSSTVDGMCGSCASVRTPQDKGQKLQLYPTDGTTYRCAKCGTDSRDPNFTQFGGLCAKCDKERDEHAKYQNQVKQAQEKHPDKAYEKATMAPAPDLRQPVETLGLRDPNTERVKVGPHDIDEATPGIVERGKRRRHA